MNARLHIAQELYDAGLAASAQLHLDQLIADLTTTKATSPDTLLETARAQRLYAKCCIEEFGQLERGVDRYEHALEAYVRAKALEKSSAKQQVTAEEAEIRQELADAYLRTRRFDKALQLCRVIPKPQRSTRVWRTIAACAEHATLNRQDVAQEAYLYIVRAHPDAVEAFDGYLRNGGSYSKLPAGVSTASSWVQVYRHEHTHQYTAAISAASAICERHPFSPSAHTRLGMLYVKNADPVSAQHAFSQARKADRFTIEHMDTYVDTLRDLRQIKLAAKVAVDLHGMCPQRSEALTALATTRLSKGKVEDYFKAEKRQTQQRSQTSITHGLVDSLVYAKRQFELLPLAKTIAELYPQHPEGLLLLGLIYRHSGPQHQATAKRVFQKVMELQPGVPRPVQELAKVYTEERNLTAATAVIETALSGRDNDILRVHYGSLLYLQGQYKLAVEQFLQALAVDPHNSTAAEYLADAERALQAAQDEGDTSAVDSSYVDE
ncbi:Anaphase promoting complex subunit 7 [Sorochytrium milnesiophthora]